MNTLAMILAFLHPAASFFLGLTVDTAAVLQPTLAILIPGAATVLAHRYIKNKTLADTVGTAAGIAYSHMSSVFANGAVTVSGVDFSLVKKQAIAVGVAAVSEMTQVGVAKVTPLVLTALVNGALGKLLASDPTFSVTGAVAELAPVINVSAVEAEVVSNVTERLAKYETPVQADASLASRPAILGAAGMLGAVNVGAGL